MTCARPPPAAAALPTPVTTMRVDPIHRVLLLYRIRVYTMTYNYLLRLRG